MGRKKKTEKLDSEDDDELERNSLYILKRLMSYVGRGNRRLIYPLAIFISLNVVVSLFTPLIFKSLIDDGLGGGINAKEGNLDLIIFLGTLFFIFTVTGVTLRIAQGYIINKIATLTMFNLRKELFVKFQHLGLDYHEGKDKTSGKKISYLTNDVNTIQELVQSGMLMIVGNFFLIFGALIFMIILSPHLTLIVFINVPILFVISGLVFKKARAYFKELREKVSVVTSELDESITGMRVIQSFGVEEENFGEFNKATEEERKTTMKAARIIAFIPAVLIFIITFGIASLLFTAGLLVREGLITQGTIVAFIFYIFMFFEPLFGLIGFFTLFQNSVAAGNRIVRLLDEEPSIEDNSDAVELTNVEGEIEYNHITFAYDPEVPVLNDINILIEPKERLAIVGYTGAGKSTFIKLLSRFYDPTEGHIKIDGKEIKDLKIKTIRENMGIVLQENFLFSGTVKDNIRYGKLDASDEEIIEVAKKVRSHEMIMKLENGYDTVVGERGSKLSEGERQLVCFARALISDPPILILDEATSSIDPYSELLIQQALEALLKGRTSISIAHRLSTIINSDRIIVLDKGKIIEEGTHKELIQRESFYKHLYDMQFKDPFKKEEIVDDDDLDQFDPTRDSFDDKQGSSKFF